MQFNLVSPFKLSPGQEEAVEQLVKNFSSRKNKLSLELREVEKRLLWQI